MPGYKKPYDPFPKKYRRKPARVGTPLTRLLRKYHLDDAFARYRFILHWKDIVGEKLAEVSHPREIIGTTLYVDVESSAWANELSFHKKALLMRLRPHLEESEQVKDIRFRVDDGTSLSNGGKVLSFKPRVQYSKEK